MLLVSTLIVSLFATLSFATPVLPGPRGQDFIEPESIVPKDICFLPPELNFSGFFKLVEDCETLDSYKDYPPSSHVRYGSSVKVCCPQAEDHITFEYEDGAEYDGGDYNYDDYEGGAGPPFGDAPFEEEEPPKDPLLGVRTTCFDLNQCGGPENFQDEAPPQICGWNRDTLTHKFLCDGDPDDPKELVPGPRGNNFYECDDYVETCKFWAGKFPESCLDDANPSFPFMTQVCMKSCGLCKDFGCEDTFERCPDWSRAGHCVSRPVEMGIYCRKSCGSCGFFSPRNTEIQKAEGKSYSRILSNDFYCGNGKPLSDINNDIVGNRPEETIDGQVRSAFGEDDDESGRKKRQTGDSEDDDDEGIFYYANEGDGEGRGIKCGIVLISDRFILAAAHCFATFAQHDSQGLNNERTVLLIRDGTPYQENIAARRIFVHPGFAYPEMYNDIALIELVRRVKYDFDVLGDSPACLGSEGDLEGLAATAEGFGCTEKGVTSDVLLTVDQDIISNIDCSNYLYSNTSKSLKKKTTLAQVLNSGINDQLFCTTGKFNATNGFYSGPCRGDSGGPLYVDYGTDDRPKKTLEGIVAGGVACGKNIPSWYTKVSSYRAWILCLMDAVNSGLSKKKAEEKCFRRRGVFVPKNLIFPR